MRKYVPRFAGVSLLIFALSLIVYAVCINCSVCADFVNSTISHGIRYLLALATEKLPFSLFELLIILAPVLLVFIIVSAVKRRGVVKKFRFLLAIVGVVSLIFTSYIYTLGIGYRTSSLAAKTGIEARSELSAEELVHTVNIVQRELNAIAENLLVTDGETHMPYTVNELSEKIVRAYDVMLAEYPILTNYNSRVKQVYFSTVMSDLRITGIYSFFTGEANVNVEYPDYCLVYTTAHEMAHQRGISRENEANFVAFLVAISSDDEYIRYSGYLNLYEYLASAIYSLDPELYYTVSAQLHQTARADILAASRVYNEHKDSVLGRINEKLNDAYLKANGTEGIVTYNYVVRLAVGYYEKVEN